jgi:predicted TIM-barrel fold metal-dependent hydrolase
MAERADAHIHLFEKGFRGSFTGRPGVQIDETLLYASLAKDHQVKRALIVGYEGDAWAKGNNAYIAAMARQHEWVRPAAFVHLDAPPDLEALKELHRQQFVGISLYIFGDEKVRAFQRISDELWSWIVQHRWLVSVNSRGRDLNGWLPILDRHRELRLVISHLGLPPRVASPPSGKEARAALDEVVNLARFPRTHVKLSGFYALSDPGHDYPHRDAWPYVEVLIEAFSPKRLLWGSDFTPSLGWLSFPQTLGLFSQMPILKEETRQQIEGANLLRLLAETK